MNLSFPNSSCFFSQLLSIVPHCPLPLAFHLEVSTATAHPTFVPSTPLKSLLAKVYFVLSVSFLSVCPSHYVNNQKGFYSLIEILSIILFSVVTPIVQRFIFATFYQILVEAVLFSSATKSHF